MGETEVVLPWIKALPLAPEYHPTEAEFADPIAYILKIEKEASQYGICKIIPPIPKLPKKVVIANLNRGLAEAQSTAAGAPANAHGSSSCGTIDGNDKDPAALPGEVKETNAVKFTTRQQQIGWSPRRPRGCVGAGPMQSVVQKSVWQSGESYTLEEFEAKAKQFSRSRLKTCKDVSPLIVETMFWKAAADKPISVEYGNDIPGTAFREPDKLLLSCPKKRKPYQYKIKREEGSEPSVLNNGGGGNGWKLSNTAWNMRIASRSHGSLLRYMPDEVPGVTSPMVYIAMLFSWFAWHVEDHDLHSLNYLHMGAPKTWYAVPGDVAAAFEEVVRCHGYGGQVNPLVAFAMLGEKTTVMSPEILMDAGVPCCRLVQNAGEFVVTFPRAYHLGFSHGFNCGEAANLATPEWLKVAKEAAVRRAAMNYLPMLSHQQLLYLLALAFYSRIPMSLTTEPRSSRLKDRKKSEGEMVVKMLFVNDVIKNNHLLSILLQKGYTRCAVLWNSASVPCGFASSPLCFSTRPNMKYTAAVGMNSLKASISSSCTAVKSSSMICGNEGLYAESSSESKEKATSGSLAIGYSVGNGFQREEEVSSIYAKFSGLKNENNANGGQLFDRDVPLGDMHLGSGLLACVSCGVLGFASMAIIQPSEEAAGNLLHAHHKLSDKHFGSSAEWTFRYNAAFCGAPSSIDLRSTSDAPIGISKNGFDNENKKHNELEVALICTGKDEIDGNLLDKQGSKQNVTDLSNLSALQNASTVDLSNNHLSDKCIVLEPSVPEDCATAACSKSELMSCEETARNQNSSSLPSHSIFLDSSLGTNIKQNLHAYPCVAQSNCQTDMNGVLNNKSPGKHHNDFFGLKNWKEASDSLSTCKDATMPNVPLDHSTLGTLGASALELLAVTYGDLLDSDEESDVIEITESKPTGGVSDVALSCDHGDELCVTRQTPTLGVCDSQCDILHRNPHLSSSNIVGKVSKEVGSDVLLSRLTSEDKTSLISTGLNVSSTNFVRDDTNTMGEGSLCASDQPASEYGTQETHFDEELNGNGTQFSFVETGTPIDQHISVATISKLNSDHHTDMEDTIKNTCSWKDSPSNQLERRSIELGEIDVKVCKDPKYRPSPNISSIRETEHTGAPIATNGSVNISISEGGIVPNSFARPLKEFDTGVDPSAPPTYKNYSCDHHAIAQVPIHNKSKELNASHTSIYVRNNNFVIPKAALSTAQTVNAAGGDENNFAEPSFLQENISYTPSAGTNAASFWKPGKGFSRPRVFCLEHAVEVEEQLQSMGGAHLLLLCHLNYPKIEEQARLLATDIGSDYSWKNIPFKNAAKDDLEIICSAVDNEEDAETGSSDWTAQLSMSLHHTVKLSRSPLYSKQMPYNPVLDAIYFSSSLDNYSGLSASGKVRDCELKIHGKAGKHQKITVAGKWCGRVWMVNQVHSYLRTHYVQHLDSSDNLRSTTVGGVVDRQRGRPRKYTDEDSACKPISEPSNTVLHDEQVFSPFLIARDVQPPVLSGKSTIIRGGDINQQRGRPRKYTICDVDYKPKSKPCGEQILTCSMKNRQSSSITRSSGEKRKLQSEGSIYNARTKAQLLESDILETDGKAIIPTPSFSLAKLEDHLQVSIEGAENVSLSTCSKRNLHIKPIASGVSGKKSKKRPVRHGDDVQVKDGYAKEKMYQACMQIQPNRGTLSEITGHDSQKCQEAAELNFPQFNSCDIFQAQKTDCSADKDHGKSDDLSLGHVESVDGLTVAMSRTEALYTSGKPAGKVRSRRKKYLKNGIEALPKNHVENVPDKEDAVSSHEHTIQDAGVSSLTNVSVSKAQTVLHSSSATDVPEGGPSTRLRSRSLKSTLANVIKDAHKASPQPALSKKASKRKKKAAKSVPFKVAEEDNAQGVEDNPYHCEIDGCTMSFLSKQELLLHKRNTCTFKGCGKQFFSHKYLLQHRRVHFDDRPLNCPWKGCKMTFKWAWARTEHIRVHTGERPYICTVPGCSQTFRFVSDFSRHKRKTGHLKQ